MSPFSHVERKWVGSVIQPYSRNPFGFQGLYHDEESTLIYNRARMLNTKLSRFNQRDPLGYPDGMNTYAAYHVMHGGVDPWGLDTQGPPLEPMPGKYEGTHSNVYANALRDTGYDYDKAMALLAENPNYTGPKPKMMSEEELSAWWEKEFARRAEEAKTKKDECVHPENFHNAMDVLGLNPMGGQWFDAVNAGAYLQDGDLWNAGISASGTLFLLGEAAVGIKMAGKLGGGVPHGPLKPNVLSKADSIMDVAGGPVFGDNIASKIRSKLNQLRKKYPNVGSVKEGGIDDACEIARQRIGSGGGRIGPPVGHGPDFAIYYDDGPVTWVFTPEGKFWSMRINEGWKP